MKPSPSPARLAPLLAGTAAGSLGPADLAEIGVRVAAVDIVELAMGCGLERLERLGGLRAFTGWHGPTVAVARMAAEAPEATGWRARALPQLVGEADGLLVLRSSVHGGTVHLARSELADWARRLGAEPSSTLTPEGIEALEWDGDNPPTRGPLIVTSAAEDRAREGRFWDRGGWADLAVAGTGREPLLEGCACRACAIATRGYLAHLWAMREITAEHLLGWHNLHQLRLLVEGPPAG